MMLKIALKAQDLSHRIYASLPWRTRLAKFIGKLAASLQEDFGKFFYGEFIRNGVAEMPPIKGQPAESYLSVVRGPHGHMRLPSGYGREFGNKAWAIALRKFGSVEVVEEAMMNEMTKHVRKPGLIKDGIDLKTAENFIITSLLRTGIDILRSRGRDRDQTSLVDEEGGQLDLTDPDAFQQLESMIPEAEMDRIMAELSRIDTRIPDLIDAKINDVSFKDLAEKWDMSLSGVYKFEKDVLPRVKSVLYRHLSV